MSIAEIESFPNELVETPSDSDTFIVALFITT